jgi:glycosyltransferase involved in cell wall biosynthesis
VQQLADKFLNLGEVWVVKYLESYDTANLMFSMRNATKGKAKIVVDVDDSIWANPICPKEDSKRYFDRAVVTTQMIKLADYVTVSTSELKRQLKSFNKNFEILPNLIDVSEWKELKSHNNKVIKIGWIYSPTHARDVKVIKGVLEQLKKEYGKKIEIIIFGTTIDLLDCPFTKVNSVKYDQYPRKLQSLKLDISVAPLEFNGWNRCKSNVKYLESTMAGAAVIATDIEPYKRCITNGYNGFLVTNNNSERWSTYLKCLVSDDYMRERMNANARDDVTRDYNINSRNPWEKFYEFI